jgi:hypothetical protein
VHNDGVLALVRQTAFRTAFDQRNFCSQDKGLFEELSRVWTFFVVDGKAGLQKGIQIRGPSFGVGEILRGVGLYGVDGSEGMLMGKGRLAFSQLYGSDSQGPDVGFIVVDGVG